MSQEHAFPEWLQKVFPASKVGPPQVQFIVGPPSGTPYRNFPTAQVATVTVGGVCKECNTGWMAALEGRCQPPITEMALGHNQGLTMSDQIELATWAVKTSMTCEMTLSQRNSLFSAEERTVVRSELRPPARVRVRVAAYAGTDGPLEYVKVAAATRRDRAYIGDLVLHTIKVGCLILQVSAPPAGHDGAAQELAIPGDIQFPIFLPSGDRSWPPRTILDDAGMVLFRKPPRS
ncbi:MAG: hypothetical protein M0027_13790 [Candidatus Dormibacteraeota bacterium]|jgi:hypothetical protein|nr:hypothetical protein [Candidatus Dormibacteraeota bacterium]